MGGKWKAVILYRLSGRTVRFTALRRELCFITQRSLTQQLREMEADGLIHRTIHPEIPPRVDNRLSDKDESLLPAPNALHAWSEAHLPPVPTLPTAPEAAG